MLEKISKFSIDKVEERHELAYVVFEQDKLVKLQGADLVLQLQYKQQFVLLLMGNIVYENALYIYYLSPDLSILDTIVIAHQYSTDQFTLLSIKQPNEVVFSFLLNDEIWQMQILEKPTRYIKTPFSVYKHLGRFWQKKYIRLRSVTA